jgi:hypothetical protein
MKKLLLISLLIVLFQNGCSNESENVRRGRKCYKRYLELVSNDPSSIKIYREEYKISEANGSVVWYLDYGAKNGYGAMMREFDTVITMHDKNIILTVTNGKIDRMIDLDDYK